MYNTFILKKDYSNSGKLPFLKHLPQHRQGFLVKMEIYAATDLSSLLKEEKKEVKSL